MAFNNITVKLPDELREGIRALKPAFALSAIQRGMEKGAMYIVGDITEKRLTGKGPFPVGEHKLGVVSGRLRKSFRSSAGYSQVKGKEVSVSIGADVEYAALHEFGFTGAVKVPAHQRTHKKSKKTHSVRAHERKMTIPERAPIRTGIKEGTDNFLAAIADELAAELDR